MKEVIKYVKAAGFAFGRTLFVDKEGNVYRNTATRIEPLTKHQRKGYEYVEVSCDGKKKKFSVHRLVAQAFLKNPNNYREVNHIDGNPMNNHADNLEWISGSDNQLHSRYVLGNQTGFKDRPVICVETNQHFASIREAWRATGAKTSHICEAAAGKRKSAGGFHWKYYEEVDKQ